MGLAQLAQLLDPILQQSLTGDRPIAGVVAGVTDHQQTIYLQHAGQRDIAQQTAIQDDSVFAIFSTSKAITTTIALQQYEQGLLDLDAPAKEYLPEIAELKVLQGFDQHGQPILHPQQRDITTRMLLLHTAGFGYDFFNADYQRLTAKHGYPSIVSGKKAALQTPLLFQPGSAWEYGANLDWAGLLCEAIGKKRLGELMQAQIFAPLGMHDTAFSISPSMQDRRVSMHLRQADGRLKAKSDFILEQNPEVQMGGHGLYSTVPDYLKFIRMWLNHGSVNGQQILQEKTIQLALANGLDGLCLKNLPGVIPALSNPVELYPEAEKGWSLGFMLNQTETNTGRPAGTIGWCGLANLYYWIDLQHDIGAYWATQTFPFMDVGAYAHFLQFETAVNQWRKNRLSAPV